MKMARTPAWATRLWLDLKTREYIPLKLLYVFLFGGMMTLFPFLTIQARSLGIKEEELGIIYGLMPLVAIITPPVSGMIADKIGNYKVFMSVTVAMSGVAALGYLLVPPGRIKHALPKTMPLSLSCSHNTSLSALYPDQCQFRSQDVQVHMTSCHVRCNNITISLSQLNENAAKTCGESLSCYLLTSNVSSISITARNQNNTKFLIPPDDFCSDKILLESGWYSSSTAKDANSSCEVQCFGEANSKQLCKKDFYWKDKNPILTFVTYTIIRLLNGMAISMSIPLFEGAAISILHKNKGDFGLQRMYANVGSMIFTPISGILIDVVSSQTGREDFSSAFYLYFAIKVVSSAIILKVNLDFKRPSDRVVKDFKVLVQQIEVASLMTVAFISGLCFGYLDTFLFWLLQDMGADKKLMGITVMVGAVFGIPFIIASTSIIGKLGHVNTIIFGFAFYVIRMMGYSLIQNPWWCMPFEALECFTVSLMSTAATTYVGELSTSSTVASLQGLHGGIQHGVGRAAGSLIGGFLTTSIGIRNTFKLMALVCGLTCISYFILNMTVIKKKTKLRREAKEKEENALENAEQKHKTEKGDGSNQENKDSYTLDSMEDCSHA